MQTHTSVEKGKKVRMATLQPRSGSQASTGAGTGRVQGDKYSPDAATPISLFYSASREGQSLEEIKRWRGKALEERPEHVRMR